MCEEKDLGGRPPKFETPEELEKMIDQYFNECPDLVTKYTQDGTKFEVPTPTITGLALYLGFCSRQSMYDYQKVDKFSYIIKKARLSIEKTYETILQHGSPTGAIFALKNMGWKDTQEIVTENKDNKSIDPSMLSEKDFKAYMKLQEKAIVDSDEE